jgi:adenylate kinase family enzyme
MKYVSQPEPQPVVRPRICILGRPKAGKSILASKLSIEYDMVLLTIPIILESILAGNENTSLARKVILKNPPFLSRLIDFKRSDHYCNKEKLLVMTWSTRLYLS